MKQDIQTLIFLAKEIYNVDGEEKMQEWLAQFSEKGYKTSIYHSPSYTLVDKLQTCICTDNYRNKSTSGEGWCMTWRTKDIYRNYITLAIYRYNETTS